MALCFETDVLCFGFYPTCCTLLLRLTFDRKLLLFALRCLFCFELPKRLWTSIISCLEVLFGCKTIWLLNVEMASLFESCSVSLLIISIFSWLRSCELEMCWCCCRLCFTRAKCLQEIATLPLPADLQVRVSISLLVCLTVVCIAVVCGFSAARVPSVFVRGYQVGIFLDFPPLSDYCTIRSFHFVCSAPKSAEAKEAAGKKKSDERWEVAVLDPKQKVCCRCLPITW